MAADEFTPPATPLPADQAQRDLDHLNLLATFHYVFGGLGILCSCFFLFYVGMGVLILTNPAMVVMKGAGTHAPQVTAWIAIAVGTTLTLAGWAFSSLWIFAGNGLKHHTHYNLIVVVTAIGFLFMPIGTVLSLFTLLTLMRPSVKALFGKYPSPAA